MKNNKYLILAALVLVLFFSINRCNENKLNVLRGEYNTLSDNYSAAKKQFQEKETARIKQKDSLEAVNKKLQKQNKEALARIEDLKAKEKALKTRLEARKKEIDVLSYKELANAYNLFYKTNQATSQDSSVVLNDSLPRRVLKDVYSFAAAKELLKLKDSTIYQKDRIITNKDNEIANITISQLAAEKNLEESKEINVKSETLNENLKNQIKKLSGSNFILKYIVPPAAFILGILTANSLSNQN